jgi:hypothetical protein
MASVTASDVPPATPSPLVRAATRSSRSSVPLSIEDAERKADQNVVQMKSVFLQIGTHCAELDQAASNLSKLVRQLYDVGIRLKDRASWTCAYAYMKLTHRPQNPKSEKTLQTYTNRLRDYLHMPPELVPDNICISAPVKDWFMAGNEIDVKFEAGWWHAVVVAITTKKLRVFWVGYPELKQFGPRSKGAADEVLNPARLDKKESYFRPHEEGAESGPVKSITVAWILQHHLPTPETFHDIKPTVVSEGEDDDESPDGLEDKDQDDRGGSKRKRTDPATNTSSSDRQVPKPKPATAKTDLTPVPAKPKKGKKGQKNQEGNAKRDGALAANRKEDNLPKYQVPPSPSAFEWLRPYFGCDVIMDGLIQLEQNACLQDDPAFFGYHVRMLEELRRGQGCFYNAPSKFKSYFANQKDALERYPVTKVAFSSENQATFVRQMNTTLRATYTHMFTRNELAVISCLLAYPGLSFCNIDQKRSLSQSDGMTRGMAFVPARLESFFHKRLRDLKLIDPVAHPQYMEPLSTVVLSSTYCYQQLMKWGVGKEIWMSLSDQAFKLAGFPEFLSVDGLYVRVHHAFDDSSDWHLYAQVKSARTLDSLGIDAKFCDTFGNDWARVIVVDKKDPTFWKAKVHVWLSIGPFQSDDPICVSRFNLKPMSKGRSAEVGQPEMFSHLDDHGAPVYQAIMPIPIENDSSMAKGSLPRFTFGSRPRADVPLEYGSTPSAVFDPPKKLVRYDKPLKTQAPHCDGNYFHAKGQWVRGTAAEPFRLSSHVPFMDKESMEDPTQMQAIFLDGPAHLNSLSFLMGINSNTTLTFPAGERGASTGTVTGVTGSLRESDAEEDTPFGGCTAISFMEKHMGSAYHDPNERPHLYAHCADLRQFPVTTAGCLIAVLAAKQRIEHLRRDRTRTVNPVPIYMRNEMDDLENALGHFIFRHLVTSTYKAGCQEIMLDQVRNAALQNASLAASVQPVALHSPPPAAKRGRQYHAYRQ